MKNKTNKFDYNDWINHLKSPRTNINEVLRIKETLQKSINANKQMLEMEHEQLSILNKALKSRKKIIKPKNK